jgi:hypothetical protein
MAGTILDTATQIIAATASDAGIQLAVNWINQRYAEYASRARTHQNRRYGSVSVPAPVTNSSISGTATTSAGSTTVTFTAALPMSLVGWQIRFNIAWYWIVAQNPDNLSVTLDTAYNEQNPGSGLGFMIVQRYIPVVDPNTRWVSAVIHQRRRKRLRYFPFEQFQSLYPGRTLVAAFPWAWTEANRYIEDLDISDIVGTQTGQKFFEVYPPSSIAETYQYVYWNIPQTFAITDSLPPEMDEYVLREGVMVDVYRYKMVQAAAANNIEAAGFWRNEHRAQMTTWEKMIQQAMVTDALYHNTVPVEIDMYMDYGEFAGDIVTAHSWIMSEWSQ